MDKNYIELENTGQIPRLVLDYLKGREDMSPFYLYEPTMDGLKARLKEMSSSKHDNQILAQVLKEQNKDVHSKQQENIEALEKGEAYTVTTGHQLCLFLGPAYVVHKITSIISLAQKVQQETGKVIIPVFWMASEDHDIEEIDHVHVFGKSLSYQSDFKGVSGDMPTAGMGEVLAELRQVLGESDEAEKLFSSIEKAYRGHSDFRGAFRAMLEDIFGESGLLILDASDKRLKKQFAQQMWKECNIQALSDSMQTTLKMLKNRGEKIQASPREINLFYLDGTKRGRIVLQEGEYSVLEIGKKWSAKELENEINEYPERFSPNVVFRPIYQEAILPNLAYIGGPGELSYWLELKDSFPVFGTTMPVLLLRDVFLYLDSGSLKKMDQFGLKAQDLFRPEHDLQKAYVKANSSEKIEATTETELIITQFDRLVDKSRGLDPGLTAFAEAEKQRLVKSLENLEKKMIRSAKKNHEKALNGIGKLLSKLLPEGKLEERKESFFAFELRSKGNYLKTVLEQADPLDPKLKVIT